jgi:hypothetical protein
MAARLFTTLPKVLAFSRHRLHDMVAASTQVALLLAFVQWLDKPTKRSALARPGEGSGAGLEGDYSDLLPFGRRHCSGKMGLHSNPRRGECCAEALVRHIVDCDGSRQRNRLGNRAGNVFRRRAPVVTFWRPSTNWRESIPARS